MQSLKVSAMEAHFKLSNITSDIDTDKAYILEPDVNRLALQLTNYFDYFDEAQVQLIGKVEASYLEHNMTREEKDAVYDRLLSYKIPCIIFTRNLQPEKELVMKANKAGIPVLQTEHPTSAFLAELIRYLNEEFAPSITMHGVLVDIYGEGVLITGESGIGKSEAALELIRRGHRLVADDAVEIKKVDEFTLVGRAPELSKYFMEVRGIGIIDVRMLFGTEAVLDSQTVDLVIKLSEWKGSAMFDRIGLQDEYVEYLGNKVVCQSIPIRPGRNIAVILETAAVNHRQKKMGYNAAQELYRRVQANIDNTIKGD